MVYKTTPLTPDFYPLRGLCKGNNSFKNEVLMYAGGCKSLSPPLPTPDAYFAAYDPDAQRFVLLIEDLGARPESLECGDQVAGLQLHQREVAAVVFESAALLHARYFDRTKAEKCAGWANEWDSPWVQSVFPIIYEMTWPELQQNFAAHGIGVDEAVLAFGTRCGEDVATQMRLCGATAETGGFMHASVLHGDFRLDNFFFEFAADGSLARDATGAPVWCMVDFQLVCCTNPAFELTFFVTTSVSTEFRRAHERALLERYYTALVGAGVPVEVFPWEVFLFHYQVAHVTSWYYVVLGGNAAVNNGERGEQLAGLLLQRYTDSFLEWDVANVFEYVMTRFVERPNQPLTVDECRALLPSEKLEWASPVEPSVDVGLAEQNGGGSVVPSGSASFTAPPSSASSASSASSILAEVAVAESEGAALAAVLKDVSAMVGRTTHEVAATAEPKTVVTVATVAAEALCELSAIDRVTSTYEDLARVPTVDSASFVGGGPGADLSIVVGCSQQDVGAAKRKSWRQTYAGVGLDAGVPTVAQQLCCPVEVAAGVQYCTSPSGAQMLLFRSEGEGAARKHSVERWGRSGVAEVLTIVDTHGEVFASADSQFGGVQWSSDESRVVYVAETTPQQGCSWWAGSGSAIGAAKVKGAKFATKGTWGEQLANAQYPRLFVLELAAMAAGPTPVAAFAEAGWSAGQPAWCPGDDGVVFTAWPHDARRLGLIYCMNRKSHLFYASVPRRGVLAGDWASPTQLTADGAFNARSPTFSPDGTALVWLGNKVGGPHGSGVRLYSSTTWQPGATAGLAPSVLVELSDDDEAPGLVALRLPPSCWISNSRLVVTTRKRSRAVVAVVDLGSAAGLVYTANEIPDGEVANAMGDELSWRVLAAADGGKVLAECSSITLAPTVMLGQVGMDAAVVWAPVSPVRSFADTAGQFEIMRFPTANVTFEAILVTPKAASDGRRPPLVVIPHGGPHSAHTTAFSVYYTALATLGYAVLLVNYRGSIGFGEPCVQMLSGRVGELDVDDCLAAVDQTIRSGTCDADKVVVQGGSHGGFLTAHLTARAPHIFKAAVIRNPVINIPSMAMVTDIPDWCFYEAGIEYGNMRYQLSAAEFEQMRLASPITHVEKVTTPALLLIGTDDKRVPPSQGWEWHYALKARGVPTSVHQYPGECHALSGVECAADVFVNMVSWFAEFKVCSALLDGL
jgi:acylaminoacyl-peptidase